LVGGGFLKNKNSMHSQYVHSFNSESGFGFSALSVVEEESKLSYPAQLTVQLQMGVQKENQLSLFKQYTVLNSTGISCS
jgi:hypothetical protein